MQEDLKMYGNQYTYAGTAYTCAYAVMQIPSTLIIQKIRPSYWLAMMEIGWGTFTFAQAGLRNVDQLYAFRFLVGFFESSFFPCLLFVLGSWYVYLFWFWGIGRGSFVDGEIVGIRRRNLRNGLRFFI
jgi:ACS family pantothenate transporter-like MFS transporter